MPYGLSNYSWSSSGYQNKKEGVKSTSDYTSSYSSPSYAQVKTSNSSWDKFTNTDYFGSSDNKYFNFSSNLIKDYELDRNRTTLDRILDGLSIGQYATMGALNYATDKDSSTSPWEGFKQGLQAGNPFGYGNRKYEYSFSDTLTNVGWEPTTTLGKLGKFAVSLGGDILLDPLTYLTFGTGSIIKGTGQVTMKAGEKVARSVATKGTLAKYFDEVVDGKSILSNLTEKYGDDYLDALAQKINHYNGVVDNNWKYNEYDKFGAGIRLNNKLGTSVISDDILRKFGDATVAPYFNGMVDSMLSNPLLKKISKKVEISDIIRQNPDKAISSAILNDVIEGISPGLNKAQVELKKMIEQASTEMTDDDLHTLTKSLEGAYDMYDVIKYNRSINTSTFNGTVESLEEMIGKLTRQLSDVDDKLFDEKQVLEYYEDAQKQASKIDTNADKVKTIKDELEQTNKHLTAQEKIRKERTRKFRDALSALKKNLEDTVQRVSPILEESNQGRVIKSNPFVKYKDMGYKFVDEEGNVKQLLNNEYGSEYHTLPLDFDVNTETINGKAFDKKAWVIDDKPVAQFVDGIPSKKEVEKLITDFPNTREGNKRLVETIKNMFINLDIIGPQLKEFGINPSLTRKRVNNMIEKIYDAPNSDFSRNFINYQEDSDIISTLLQYRMPHASRNMSVQEIVSHYKKYDVRVPDELTKKINELKEFQKTIGDSEVLQKVFDKRQKELRGRLSSYYSRQRKLLENDYRGNTAKMLSDFSIHKEKYQAEYNKEFFNSLDKRRSEDLEKQLIKEKELLAENNIRRKEAGKHELTSTDKIKQLTKIIAKKKLPDKQAVADAVTLLTSDNRKLSDRVSELFRKRNMYKSQLDKVSKLDPELKRYAQEISSYQSMREELVDKLRAGEIDNETFTNAIQDININIQELQTTSGVVGSKYKEYLSAKTAYDDTLKELKTIKKQKDEIRQNIEELSGLTESDSYGSFDFDRYMNSVHHDINTIDNISDRELEKILMNNGEIRIVDGKITQGAFRQEERISSYSSYEGTRDMKLMSPDELSKEEDRLIQRHRLANSQSNIHLSKEAIENKKILKQIERLEAEKEEFGKNFDKPSYSKPDVKANDKIRDDIHKTSREIEVYEKKIEESFKTINDIEEMIYRYQQPSVYDLRNPKDTVKTISIGPDELPKEVRKKLPNVPDEKRPAMVEKYKKMLDKEQSKLDKLTSKTDELEGKLEELKSTPLQYIDYDNVGKSYDEIVKYDNQILELKKQWSDNIQKMKLKYDIVGEKHVDVTKPNTIFPLAEDYIAKEGTPLPTTVVPSVKLNDKKPWVDTSKQVLTDEEKLDKVVNTIISRWKNEFEISTTTGKYSRFASNQEILDKTIEDLKEMVGNDLRLTMTDEEALDMFANLSQTQHFARLFKMIDENPVRKATSIDDFDYGFQYMIDNFGKMSGTDLTDEHINAVYSAIDELALIDGDAITKTKHKQLLEDVKKIKKEIKDIDKLDIIMQKKYDESIGEVRQKLARYAPEDEVVADMQKSINMSKENIEELNKQRSEMLDRFGQLNKAFDHYTSLYNTIEGDKDIFVKWHNMFASKYKDMALNEDLESTVMFYAPHLIKDKYKHKLSSTLHSIFTHSIGVGPTGGNKNDIRRFWDVSLEKFNDNINTWKNFIERSTINEVDQYGRVKTRFNHDRIFSKEEVLTDTEKQIIDIRENLLGKIKDLDISFLQKDKISKYTDDPKFIYRVKRALLKGESIDEYMEDINNIVVREILDVPMDLFETNAAKVLLARGQHSNKIVYSNEINNDLIALFSNDMYELAKQKGKMLGNVNSTWLNEGESFYMTTYDFAKLFGTSAETNNAILLGKGFTTYKGKGIGSVLDETTLAQKFAGDDWQNKLNDKFIKVDMDKMPERIKQYIISESATSVSGKERQLKFFKAEDKFLKHFENVKREQFSDNVENFLSAYDYFQRLWKLNVTVLSPSFHIGNKMGAMFNNFLDIGFETFNPKHRRESFDIYLRKHGIFKDNKGKTYSYAELRSMAEEYGIVHRSFYTQELEDIYETGKKIGDDPRKVKWLKDNLNMSDDVIDKLDAFNPIDMDHFIPFVYGTKWSVDIENQDRMVNFLAHIRNGMHPSIAAERVNHFLFDYSQSTEFEKNVIRRLIPFWTWLKSNTSLQAEMLMRRPIVYRHYAHVRNSFQAQVPEEERLDNNAMPEYASDYWQTGYNYKHSETGRNKRIMFDPGLPINDLSVDVKKIVSRLSPFVKTPIELGTGQSLYFGTPLREEPMAYVSNQTLVGSITKRLNVKDDREGLLNALGFMLNLRLSDVSTQKGYYLHYDKLLQKIKEEKQKQEEVRK